VTGRIRYHRRARLVWLAAAGFSIIERILLVSYAPTVAPYLVGPSTWVWCLVGAAYHHGWLHRGPQK